MKAEANHTAGFRCKHFQCLVWLAVVWDAYETNILIVFMTYASLSLIKLVFY